MKTNFLSVRLKTALFCGAGLALALAGAVAQPPPGRNVPHIGYAMPAGLRQGSSCDVVVGGQFLDGTLQVLVSGEPGVTGTVVRVEKPLPQKRINEFRDYLEQARKKLEEVGTPPREIREQTGTQEGVARILKETGAADEEIQAFFKAREQRKDPKRQQNQQIAERVTLKLEAAPDAPSGPRELRLVTPRGLSNPMAFCVGTLPELRKEETAGKPEPMRVPLPAVLNGQILPGEADRFAFEARRDARIVVAVQARDLIPYLADAVPGWFQPVAAIRDAKGKEVAFSEDYLFNPDPVFCFRAPEDGTYTLELRDALYRGREDFIYRVTVGEVPYVTAIFPLGGSPGRSTVVRAGGWNLPQKKVVVDAASGEGRRTVAAFSNGRVIPPVVFADDALQEAADKEPNDEPRQATAVKLPVVINGRIGAPGDVDTYAVQCAAGARVVVEAEARRLGSPLDSWLKVTGADGRQVAFNDDAADPGSGYLTHKADSYLTFTATNGGVYYVQIGDSQRQGGADAAYRLRISPPRPDFALRIVPSSLNGHPGGCVPVTVYALRKDGYAGPVALSLKGPSDGNGFSIDGGVIPEGQDKIRATITFPKEKLSGPVELAVEGRAECGGRPVVHEAVPADDMLQAFAYHHLVPARTLAAFASGSGPGRPPLQPADPVAVAPGGVGRAVFRLPKGRPGQWNDLRFELSEPPEGIVLEKTELSANEGSVFFRADTAKVKRGLAGNLILEVFVEKTPPPKDGKPQEKRRVSLGCLPAIPFRVP